MKEGDELPYKAALAEGNLLTSFLSVFQYDNIHALESNNRKLTTLADLKSDMSKGKSKVAEEGLGEGCTEVVCCRHAEVLTTFDDKRITSFNCLSNGR